MSKLMMPLILVLTATTHVHAHVADHLPAGQHAIEHLWLALLVVPLVVLLRPWLRSRNK